MREPVSILPVKHPRYKFVVCYPENESNGTEVRRKTYFKTRLEAKAFAAEREAQIASHGAKHSHVHDDERTALMRYRTWCDEKPDAPSLLELVNEAIAARERIVVSCTVRELVEARLLLAEKEGLSQRHLGDLDYRLRHFSKNYGNRQAASLTTEEITHWLHGRKCSAQSFVNNKRVIGSIFTLGVRLGKISVNPVAKISSPKVVRKAPAILAPAELHQLLSSAPERLLPMLVLQAFAGIRRAESERITWGHIHLMADTPFIELPSAVTKGSRRRITELTPNAVEWLIPLASSDDKPLGYGTANYRYDLEQTAKAAGIEWSPNLLRHSYGSYRLAQIKNAAQVAEEMGNSPKMVHTHYHNLVRPAAVTDYWKITPERVSGKVLAFPSKSKRKAS